MTHNWSHLQAVAGEVVEHTLSTLPVPLQEQSRKLPITFEPLPSPALQRDGIASDTLGLFVGPEFTNQGHVPMPPQIMLFLANLWELAEGDEEDYQAEIRTTLLHELGHYLGLDEEELAERGLD